MNIKKLSLLLLAVLMFSVGFSQQKQQSRKTLEAAVEADFTKLFSTNKPVDLVPFYSNGKWGYLNRNTMKVVLPARYDELYFFNPDMVYSTSYNGLGFTVDKHGEIAFEKEHADRMSISVERAKDLFADIDVVSSKNGFKGFTVDKNGKLKSYSDIYHVSTGGSPFWNVNPFKYKNGYLAIASMKGDRQGVIDSLGNALPGFDFNYMNIRYNEYAKDKDCAWFFVQDSTGNWSVKSDDGQLLFKNELFDWPISSATYFGISLFDKDGMYGIFDCHELKWVVKPQTKPEVYRIRYSSEEELDADNPLDRAKAHIYYLVIDGKSQYYVDLDGRKYVPKKK